MPDGCGRGRRHPAIGSVRATRFVSRRRCRSTGTSSTIAHDKRSTPPARFVVLDARISSDARRCSASRRAECRGVLVGLEVRGAGIARHGYRVTAAARRSARSPRDALADAGLRDRARVRRRGTYRCRNGARGRDPRERCAGGRGADPVLPAARAPRRRRRADANARRKTFDKEAEIQTPADLRYSEEHEWCAARGRMSRRSHHRFRAGGARRHSLCRASAVGTRLKRTAARCRRVGEAVSDGTRRGTARSRA